MACSPKFALGPAPKLRREERNVRDVPDPTFTGLPQTDAIDPKGDFRWELPLGRRRDSFHRHVAGELF